jgi:hypothetical protein
MRLPPSPVRLLLRAAPSVGRRSLQPEEDYSEPAPGPRRPPLQVQVQELSDPGSDSEDSDSDESGPGPGPCIRLGRLLCAVYSESRSRRSGPFRVSY